MHAIIYYYDIHAMKYSCYEIHAMKYNCYDIYAMKRTSAVTVLFFIAKNKFKNHMIFKTFINYTGWQKMFLTFLKKIF